VVKGAESWTLDDLLSRSAERFADRPLLAGGEREVPYGEFDRRVSALAAGLRALGLEPGDRLAAILPNGEELLYLFFAAARSGTPLVPINPALALAETAPILKASGARALVAGAAAVERHGQPSLLSIVAGEEGANGKPRLRELLRAPSPRPAVPPAAAGDPACILYTSGTTGRPKGAALSHTSFVLPALEFGRWMEVEPDDRFLGCLPLFHMAGLAFATSAVASGASLVLVDHFSGSHFWAAVECHRITLMRHLGEMLAVLCRLPGPARGEHTLRAVYGGGASAEVAEDFERRFGAAVVEGYGLTETNTVLRNELAQRRRGSIGRPLPYGEVRVVGPGGEELPPGREGEIEVRRNAVMMLGYHGDDERTSKVFRNGWLRTGDLGYRDGEGFFYFTGRLKNLIRRRGENVSPTAVEAVLNRHPAIAEAAVVGVPDEVGGEEIKACLVSSAELDPEELARWCRDFLAEFEIPRYLEFCDRLPRTATHKIDRARLADRGHTCDNVYDRKAPAVEGDSTHQIFREHET